MLVNSKNKIQDKVALYEGKILDISYGDDSVSPYFLIETSEGKTEVVYINDSNKDLKVGDEVIGYED